MKQLGMVKECQLNYTKFFIVRLRNYIFYVNEDELQAPTLNDRCGKWIVNVGSYECATKACLSAIRCRLVKEAKHTNDGSMCFFYINNYNEEHKKFVKFLLDRELIPKTKSGKFYNLAYKLDSQTKAGQYGRDSVSRHLSEFIDLKTGKEII